ncbi:MAG: hypothetical protein KDI73_09415, partial [Candidatus Competibacteraceae bacterium]|nr:hypothetical protein [Candidatus Competibacteraceae bacterium]
DDPHWAQRVLHEVDARIQSNPHWRAQQLVKRSGLTKKWRKNQFLHPNNSSDIFPVETGLMIP